MTAEMLVQGLLKANLAGGSAVLLALALRGPVRAGFGPRAAYALWLAPLLAGLGVLLPAPRLAAAPAVEAVVAAAPQVSTTPMLAAPAAAAPVAAVQTLGDALTVDYALPLATIWALGALAGLLVLAARQHRFVRALGPLKPEPDGLFRAARGLGPAVVGVFAPKVVLPADFTERYDAQEQALVVAHERAHLAAGDPQINTVSALVQCLCWFNPLVHLAARLVRVDQELACDAAVIARFPGARRRYAEAMLKTQLAPVALPAGCLWPAPTQAMLKQRVRQLGRVAPGAARRLAGLGLAVTAASAAAFGAWAAQPARPTEAPASAAVGWRERALGGQLVEALVKGDEPEALRLIAEGADVNHRALGDGTPLILAARDGHTAVFEALLARGADVRLASPGDGDPLIMAAREGRADIVRALVERGADVNAYVPSDETPLINAAREGRLEVVRYLVEHGADVNLAVMAPRVKPLPPERRSPLGQALAHGHAEVAAYLQGVGARA